MKRAAVSSRSNDNIHEHFASLCEDAEHTRHAFQTIFCGFLRILSTDVGSAERQSILGDDEGTKPCQGHRSGLEAALEDARPGSDVV